MKVKEKVIHESIKRINKRLVIVKEILHSNPLSEIIDLRKKASEILKEHKGDYNKIAELIEPLASKEKVLFRLSKRQIKDSSKLIDEQVSLECELGELQNELFWIKRKAV